MMNSETITESPRIVRFRVNRPQAAAMTAMANETWLLWGRGTGKTQGVIAPWILHKVEQMPRSNGGLIGKSFADLETKILQPIFLAWETLGFEKDEHYTYGKTPPEAWEKPLTPIIDWTHVIAFPNGTTIELISLHQKGSANGKSLQWIVADEVKLLNETQLREEVFPILRGHKKYFGDSPWYRAKLFVSDKLSPNIHWILEKKKLCDKKLVASVMLFQLQLNELQQQLATASASQAPRLKRKMRRLDKLIATIRRNLVYYGEANARDNIENLGEGYFENMKRSLSEYEYRIAIENEDPTRVEHNFYASRSERHLHNVDADDDVSKPLAVALDYQHSITPLVSAQVNTLVNGTKTLNFLHSIYVKAPLGLKHVIDDFCELHRLRPCKRVYYFYDHTAIGRRNMHKAFAEEVQEYFEANGWDVEMFYMGQAPSHNLKFKKINAGLQTESDATYQTFFHQNRCATLVMAMDMTETKLSPTEGVKKNKDNERNENVPQELTTHFPDVFDQLWWGVQEMNIYPMDEGDYVRATVGVR